jgi:MFS-type transporter involved in bile tolerance (Atg22 family)
MGHYFRKNFGHHGLIWFSVATQIGALIGALIIFILTNTFQLFQERNMCDQTAQCF